MTKIRHKYSVYQCTIRDYNGYGVNENSRVFVGETWATSPAQAVNNISFRTGIKKHVERSMRGDGVAVSWLEAVTA